MNAAVCRTGLTRWRDGPPVALGCDGRSSRQTGYVTVMPRGSSPLGVDIRRGGREVRWLGWGCVGEPAGGASVRAHLVRRVAAEAGSPGVGPAPRGAGKRSCASVVEMICTVAMGLGPWSTPVISKSLSPGAPDGSISGSFLTLMPNRSEPWSAAHVRLTRPRLSISPHTGLEGLASDCSARHRMLQDEIVVS